MAIIKMRASLRVKRFYINVLHFHSALSRDAVLIILKKIREEMLALDNGVPDGCHIVNPSYLSLWNEKQWIDVSSVRTKWHYAFTHNGIQAVIHDAEHSQNMSDEAIRPI